MPRYSLALFALAAGLSAAPAVAEVHATSENGFITRDAVTVKASPTDTWLALTKPGEWWSDEHTWSGDAANMTLTPQGGGCFCERIPGSDAKGGFQLSGSVQHGTVIQANPLKILRLIGSLGPLQSEPVTGILTFAMKEVVGGTQIQMEYNVGGTMRFKVAEIAPLVDKVLSEQLARLRDHLGPLGAPAAKPETAAPEKPTTETVDPDLEAQIDALGKGDPVRL